MLSAQTFVSRTMESGLAVVSHTNGVAVADYDRDGDEDIYFVGQGAFYPDSAHPRDHLMRNNGNGTFTDMTAESGIVNTGGRIDTELGYRFGAFWGDFDNDGTPDLFLSNAGPDLLYRNRGDGTFEDITTAAGIERDTTMVSTGAVWWDYDRDGDLDLYVCNYGPGQNQMYENELNPGTGGATFRNVTAPSGLGDRGRTWGALPFDANEDGWPDLYVVNDFGGNHLYLSQGGMANPGDGITFREATAEFGLGDDGNGMGITLGDYDNDGRFEIYLTNITGYSYNDTNPFFTRGADGKFVNIAAQLGVADTDWGWGTQFFDCDHDGDLDLYAVAGCYLVPGPYPNFFFLNEIATELRYVDGSAASGTDDGREARGLVTFDYDNDGDLDLLVSNFQAPPVLYENRAAGGNWLKIRLSGTTVNRSAFGAVVLVEAGGETYLRQHDGTAFLGQSIQPLHFGLAQAALAARITVKWPGGTETVLHEVPVNQTISIAEGQLTALPAPPAAAPDRFRLLSNFPNPFNGGTRIRFTLPHPGAVTVVLANARGQEVHRWQQIFGTVGTQEIYWDTRDQRGEPVSSGIYFYHVTFQGHARTGKMLYVR